MKIKENSFALQSFIFNIKSPVSVIQQDSRDCKQLNKTTQGNVVAPD